MRFTANPSDIDTIKNATALRCKSLFAAKALADNIGVGPAALEKWLFGHARLAPSALEALVLIIFHGKSRWDAESGTLIEVVKPSTTMMSGADLPHGDGATVPLQPHSELEAS
jgi:hypothetical protein